MDKPILWLIDENDTQLKTFHNALRELMPDSIDVRALSARENKEDYLDILENPNTACIILDQRLKDTGVASYFGIELAQYLRGIDKKIPIYILTNWAKEKDEFVGGEWSIEDIIDKSDLTNISSNEARVAGARIVRHINIYQDIQSERAVRFNELLKRSLKGDLAKEELAEMDELETTRAATILARELEQLKTLEVKVERYKKLMKDFQNSTKGEQPE
jgi:hypothetical protein